MRGRQWRLGSACGLLTALIVLGGCAAPGKTAEFAKPEGPEWIVELPGLAQDATPLILVRIPPGSFQMGSPEPETGRDPNESPVHSVKITDSFYIGKYEITQAQWVSLMKENPSTETDPDYPVN